MIKKGVVFIFVLLSTFGYAQQKVTRSFNLEEAIAFAIDSNYTAINARRDIAMAIKQKMGNHSYRTASSCREYNI